MLLSRIIAKKTLTVVGLNSGTSADAMDAAAVRIARRAGKIRVNCLATSERKLPNELAAEIRRIGDAETVALDDLIRLDGALGAAFGRVAGDFVRRLSRSGVRVDLIASHGQTVRHAPELESFAGGKYRGTLQLGSVDRIAAKSGLVTVGDFRQADVAVGGEGAPITIGAMQRMFASRSESRLIVNVGGMSNYFFIPRGNGPARGADCGPGNAVCDELARELFGKKYDRYGRLARSGEMSEPLLRELQRDPFFSGGVTSTGRERFGREMAQRMIVYGRRHRLDPTDLMATALELTVASIAHCAAPLLRRDRQLSKLYLTGGGRRNRFLVCRLSHLLPEAEIVPVDKLGIDGDFVEAVAFAVMGEAAMRGEALSEHRRGRRAVLGRIAQPPKE